MNVLFYLESLALHLHLDADINVKSLCIRSKRRIVSVLDISSGIFQVLVLYTCLDEFLVQVFCLEELSGTVNHRAPDSLLVLEGERSDVVLLSDTVIIRAEGWSDVNDSGTFFCRDEISADNSHSILFRKYPRQKLLISDAFQILTLEAVQDLVLNLLEVDLHKVFCNYVDCRFSGIWVGRSNSDVLDVRPYAKRHV